MKETIDFFMSSWFRGNKSKHPALVVCLFLFFSLSSFSQLVTGRMRGTSEKDSTMSWRQMLLIPRDTIHRLIKEPQEETEPTLEKIWTPEPGSIIHRASPIPQRTNGTRVTEGVRSLSPAPATNFTGTNYQSQHIPPDVQGAAGSTYLVEMENEETEIFTKTGTAHSTVAINTFWTSMSPSTCYDSRIRYDPYAQRWIAITDDYASSSSSCFYIGISETSDPTGTWQFHKIRADSTGTLWADYPMLGFNKTWVVVTANMFTVSGGTSSACYLWAFDKADLYNNSVQYTRLNLSSLYSMQPATTYDSTEAKEFMMITLNATSGYVGLYYINGTVGSESLNLASYLQAGLGWSFSPASNNSAPQKGTTNDIDLDDSRMQNVVYRNGYVWGVQNVYLPASSPTRCSVQWWQTDTLGNIYQHNLLDDSAGGVSYAYPSISVNSYNDALIGYSSFSSSQYASADYSFRYGCDTLGKLESDYQFKAGGNSYYLTYGTGYNRWGDYTGTMVDPADDETFWTVQEYATTTQNSWGTWWAKVSPAHNANGGSGTWTWTGERSTSWFEPCNWDKGSLPDASSDVIIPGATTYAPKITGAAANCKTITIATSSGGVVNIDDTGGGSLKVAQ